MSTYVYELPTTGAISFTDFCIDHSPNGVYATHVSEATQARANLRAILKDSKRTDGEKDYLKVVKTVDEYLPHLYGVIACFEAGEIAFSPEPVFSWRSTLSSHLFNSSPREEVNTIYAELAFTLLTLSFALSNLARSTVASLGNYENDRATVAVERKAKDEKLNFAVTLLCRASGLTRHICDVVLPKWDSRSAAVPQGTGTGRPPDVSLEVLNALSKMALADAHTLAIRKLLTKSAYDSTLSPGPPLPKSHPSPTLIAKLYLECASLYSSARSLAKTPAKARSSANSKDKSKDTDDVSHDLRRYLADEILFCNAMAKKWLGVDAGENGGQGKAGQSVAFLKWSKEDLEDLKGGGKGVNVAIGAKGKEVKDRRKEKVAEELSSVGVFLTNYHRMNETLHFQPVPPTASLQSLIPAGVAAVASKPYTPPDPGFGPGSVEHTQRAAEALDLAADDARADYDGDPSHDISAPGKKTGSYAGAGQYY